MEAKNIETLFFHFNDNHLLDNAIFPSDILLYIAYGDVCKKANITFVGKCFIVQITIRILHRSYSTRLHLMS